MNTINLNQWDIKRPEKIAWRFPDYGQVLEHIKSKSLRRFLSRTQEILDKEGLTVKRSTISKQSFQDWLPYYMEKMTEQSYEILATIEWYEKKTVEGKKVEAVFIFKDEQMVGSLLYTIKGNEKASIAFRASDREDIGFSGRSSIGALLDFYYLTWMRQDGLSIISAGQSRNAFGVINTLGNLDYKLRFGYFPSFDNAATLLPTVPTDEKGMVVFFGIQDNRLTLFSLQPKDLSTKQEIERFSSSELPFVYLTHANQ